MLDIVDVKAVCDSPTKAGAKVVLDNAFATPMLQRPLEFGAGHRGAFGHQIHRPARAGRSAAQSWARREFIIDKLQRIIRNTGPSMSPFNA